MRALALAAAGAGASVSGSDLTPGPALEALARAGVGVAVGNAACHVETGSEVVYSSAVPADNVERRRAAELGLRQIRRGDLLAELASLKRCIAVAGAHGKTTTAAMIAHVLAACGYRPGHVIGAELRDGTPSARWSDGEWLVVEADESDRSFLAVRPEVAVVTNVELDHVESYATLSEVVEAFGEFAAGARVAVVPARPALQRLGPGALVPRAHDISLGPWGSRFTWRGRAVTVRLPGRHNVRNAVAALEACRAVGADPDVAVSALAGFPGVRRRIELVGTGGSGARVYSDYVCHATAVRASVAAVRTVEAGRVVAVFEPLRYSRTRIMASALGRALARADVVVVLELFAGVEAYTAHPVASGEAVANAARGHCGGRPVVFAPTAEEATEYLRGELGAADACLVMGVGPVSAGLAAELVGS
jgi:UDP-N-acetylmuramate--alanine ligase